MTAAGTTAGSGSKKWPVQQRLEQALSKVADAPISVLCAGRTDAGVHATGQVVHFETTARRRTPPGRWGKHPSAAGYRGALGKPVADDFHARFSATARRYRYIIFNHRYRPAVLQQG